MYQQTLLQQRQPAHYFVPLNNNWVGFVILMGCGIGHVAMKIVADQDITHVSEFFSACGELRLKPGRTLSRDDVKDADAILIRSVTPVNASLLEGAKVKFVGSVVTGTDHLDTAWLAQAGIRWRSSLGCNATAVVEYVVCTVAALQAQGLLQQTPVRAGVVGVGRIGSQVATRLQQLGFTVVLCDPLRAEQEANFSSVPLADFAELDVITFHTPLTKTGPYPTYHAVDRAFLQRQKPGCVLLNSGRGAVIDFAAWKQYGQHLTGCFDVWEGEPAIDPVVMNTARIATPHIAGHSVQSKFRAVEMIYQAAIEEGIITQPLASRLHYPEQRCVVSADAIDWRDVVLQCYNPMKTSAHMKHVLTEMPDQFDALRRDFSVRHEFGYTHLEQLALPDDQIQCLKALGFIVS